MSGRWTSEHFRALFEPRGVIVAGASTHPGKFGFVALHNILANGYEGRVFATNLEATPVLVQTRMTAEDVTLGGVHIPAGAILDVVAGSANRDPEKFPNPERFDIFRPRGARHVAFATGPHICIGQHLARVEMTRALNSILDRLPNLRLDPDKPLPQIRGGMMRVPEHLYVRFDAVRQNQ